MAHHFISYSTGDAQEFALKLHDALEGGYPKYEAWLDKRDLKPGKEWDVQLDAAINLCASLLFVMTPDSVEEASGCTLEWKRALQYKKPLVLLKLKDCQIPFRLQDRQYIDFADFDAGMAKLRQHLDWLKTPAAELQRMRDELTDMQRKRLRAPESEYPRIDAAIKELQERIERQEIIVADPEAARERTQKSIAAGIERARQPERPVAGRHKSKFINTPPLIAPKYFQDRFAETKRISDFLRAENQRVLHMVGRGGIGKTAVVCRLLKSLEGGKLPDDNGELSVDGIVYLSAVGSRKLKTSHIFADLARLLPDEEAKEVDGIYKDAQASTQSKVHKLLTHFQQGRYVLLLDNFEDVVDAATGNITDSELDEALRAFVDAPYHAVSIIITTRVLAKALRLYKSQLQGQRRIDEGLESPYAENVLREMDDDGTLGLKDAPMTLLSDARERTRGYPRALEALVAWLQADLDTSLDEVLRVADKQLPENVVETLVGEAYNRLPSTARQVMQALAIFGRPVSAIAVDYLLEQHLPQVDSAPILSRLVNMHFARREGSSYYLHPVDRQYALGLIEEGDKSDLPPPMTEIEKLIGKRLSDNGTNKIRFTRTALYNRGADYFKTTRKPRDEWKTRADLQPQIDEFDLRCAAGDWDTAVTVLIDIDWDYLMLWGFYREVAEMHERLQGNITSEWHIMAGLNNLSEAYYRMGGVRESIPLLEQGLEIARARNDKQGEAIQLGNLGNRYANLGETHKAIEYYEQALVIAREIGNRQREAIQLGNLGNRYANLGEMRKAIDYYQQALVIDREIGDRRGEAADLGNLGNRYYSLGETHKAIDYTEQALVIDREIGSRQGEAIRLSNIGLIKQAEGNWQEAIDYHQQSMQIADDIGLRQMQNAARQQLAQAYLYAGDLAHAQQIITDAQQYEFPQTDHAVYAVAGVIALRLSDKDAARNAFETALTHCAALLGHAAQNYEALDSKGLALCGLALVTGDAKYVQEAVTAFTAAREIISAKGVVDTVLRLFDALAVVDDAGLLADARSAAAGA